MSIDYNKCAYMNAEKQNAYIMMKPCINGSDPLVWPCIEKETLDKDIFSIVTERPNRDNYIPEENVPAGNVPEDNVPQTLNQNPTVEGFTNMGESYVRPGDCPDGYFRCPISGKCLQVCMNCKYNQRTYGKSKEFNEADPCFPDRGVYNGIDEFGNVKCTCGLNNQYCNDYVEKPLNNDLFDSQGGMMVDNVYIMNVGDYNSLGKLASY